MTGQLAYMAGQAHIDDLHREAAAERLAEAVERPRRPRATWWKHLLVATRSLSPGTRAGRIPQVSAKVRRGTVRG